MVGLGLKFINVGVDLDRKIWQSAHLWYLGNIAIKRSWGLVHFVQLCWSFSTVQLQPHQIGCSITTPLWTAIQPFIPKQTLW